MSYLGNYLGNYVGGYLGSVEAVINETVSSDLDLTQDVVGYKEVSQTLSSAFDASSDAAWIVEEALVSALDLASSMVDELEFIESELPSPGRRFPINMTCPFDGVGTIRSIDLPSPDLGDKRSVETPVAYKMSMSGKLYGRVTQPRPEVLDWTFSHLPRLKCRELEDFVDSSAGRFIRLVDFTGLSWKVKLSLEVFKFNTIGRGNGAGVPEDARVIIHLEGSRLP